MPPSTTASPTLVDDVLLHVLCFCDIPTVLAFSGACRHLHDLAFEKQVWLALLQDLHTRLGVHRPPGSHLLDLSASELLESVKRVVYGPETWSRHCPSQSIDHQIVLYPKVLNGPGVLTWENEVKLIAGGRYVLFNNWKKLECWSVAEERCVWQQQSQAETLEFAVDDVDSGEAAVILLCQRRRSSEICMEIIRLNFGEGLSEVLLSTCTADEAVVHPRISGDIAAVGIRDTNRIILMDWKKQSCVVLLSSGTVHDVALVNGNIIVVEPSQGFPAQCRIIIWSLESFTKHWSPPGFLANWNFVSSQEVGPRLSHNISLPQTHIARQLRLCVHASPLRSDVYRMWVCITSDPPDADFPFLKRFSAIRRYRLFLHSAIDGRLHLETSMQVNGAYHFDRPVSYSGHTKVLDQVERVTRLLALSEMATGQRAEEGDDSNEDRIDLPDAGDAVDVSAYGGALAYATHRSLVINYYK